jgi:hypothetical protein
MLQNILTVFCIPIGSSLYADYVNLLGKNINIIKKNTEDLLDSNKRELV